MKKTILVTGANGQLGSELKVLASNYANFEFIFADLPDFDLLNQQSLSRFFETNTVDYIVNAAAYTAVDKAENDKENAMLGNFNIVDNLAKMSLAHNSKLIHISTDYVFDGMTYTPYSEDDYTNPNSIYGETKRAAELLLEEADIDYITIRTSWLYSSFGNNFVKTMLRLAAERTELSVISDQVGTPTYARDLAQTILHIIQSDIKPEQTIINKQIYHYSNEGVASWYDFAAAIFEYKNINIKLLPIPTSAYPTPAARPAYSVLNKHKIKQMYGIEIPHWRQSLQQCLLLL